MPNHVQTAIDVFRLFCNAAKSNTIYDRSWRIEAQDLIRSRGSLLVLRHTAVIENWGMPQEGEKSDVVLRLAIMDPTLLFATPTMSASYNVVCREFGFHFGEYVKREWEPVRQFLADQAEKFRREA